jgi:hypothetical protein
MARRLVASVVLVTAVVLMSGRTATAASCMPDTLQAYITNGSCSIGDAVFADWALLATPAAATPIDPARIQVSPITPAGQIGFLFGLNVDASFDEFFDSVFHYSVSGGSAVTFSGAHLAMSGSSATGLGAVTAVEDVCVGSDFNPGTIDGCPALAHLTNIVFELDGVNDLNESVSFPKNGLLGIVNDIGVDGTFGAASLNGQVTNLFDVQVVPEPATGLLVAAGLEPSCVAPDSRIGPNSGG